MVFPHTWIIMNVSDKDDDEKSLPKRNAFQYTVLVASKKCPTETH